MKIMFYALRPFDERAYCEPYSKQYGIDYAYTAEVPTPDNLELAKGCDAVSTNPCLITPEYLEAWAAMGVKFLPCRSIGYDHIPQQKAKELGMRISHSWYPPAGVADYAIMLMLMCNRKVGQILRRADAQDYSLKGKMGRDLSTMTVGVIGTGDGDFIGKSPADNRWMIIVLHNQFFHLGKCVGTTILHMHGDIWNFRPHNNSVFIA